MKCLCVRACLMYVCILVHSVSTGIHGYVVHVAHACLCVTPLHTCTRAGSCFKGTPTSEAAYLCACVCVCLHAHSEHTLACPGVCSPTLRETTGCLGRACFPVFRQSARTESLGGAWLSPLWEGAEEGGRSQPGPPSCPLHPAGVQEVASSLLPPDLQGCLGKRVRGSRRPC